MSKQRLVFTTGQVAKICQVAPRTVSKWFDSGKLKGYRIPGSQDRRIPRDQLIRFLKDNGMPLGSLEQESWHKILIVGAEPLFIERLREQLTEDDDYKYEVAHSGFEAGTKAHAFQPDTIIIDHAMGRHEAMMIAKTLRNNEAYKETMIVALASEDEPNEQTLIEPTTGYSDAFKKPFDINLLAERIRTLVEQKRDL